MEDHITREAQNFENRVSADLHYFVCRYREKFGNRIDTDNARELCPAYANSYETRALLAPLIHESASRIAKAVWRTLLDESSGKPGLVIFLAGGPGSGKSTVAKFDEFQKYFQEAIVVYDSTFSSFSSAKEKIQDALDAGKNIDIYYVHRNAKDAADSVVVRAVETGRTVPIREVSSLHWSAQRTIFKLCDEYRDSEDVIIQLFNNGGEPESFDLFDDEAALRKIQYSSIVEVEGLVSMGAKEAYGRVCKTQGSFPKSIERGIFGRESTFCKAEAEH